MLDKCSTFTPIYDNKGDMKKAYDRVVPRE